MVSHRTRSTKINGIGHRKGPKTRPPKVDCEATHLFGRVSAPFGASSIPNTVNCCTSLDGKIIEQTSPSCFMMHIRMDSLDYETIYEIPDTRTVSLSLSLSLSPHRVHDARVERSRLKVPIPTGTDGKGFGFGSLSSTLNSAGCGSGRR